MNNRTFPATAPLVGQPFTITSWIIPVTCQLFCNCQVPLGGKPTLVHIKAGSSETCTECHTLYSVGYNPKTGDLQVAVGKPNQEQKASQN